MKYGVATAPANDVIGLYLPESTADSPSAICICLGPAAPLCSVRSAKMAL